MLPLSAETPNIPLILINRTQLPPIPNITCPPELNYLIPDLAVSIINKLINYAPRNPVRMFCLNLLSRNYWSNAEFEEVFNYCIAHILMLLRNSQGQANVIGSAESSVENILSLYSSELVFKFQDLQNLISPEQYQASSQNAGLFHNLKSELRNNSFNFNQQIDPRFNQHNSNAHAFNYGGASPQFAGHPPLGSGYNRLPNSGQVSFAPTYFNQLNQDSGLRQYNSDNAVGSRTSFIASGSGSNNQDFIDVSFTDKDSNRYRREPADQTNSYSQSSFSKHNLSETTVKETIYDADVITSASESLISKEKNTPNLSSMDTIMSQLEVAVEFIPHIAVDLSIDLVMAQLRAKVYNADDLAISCQYGINAVAIMSALDPKTFISSLFETNKSKDKIKLRDIITAIKIYLNNSKSVSKMDKDVLTLIKEIDVWLTDKINDFLIRTLELGNTIGSFITDYDDICELIDKKSGKNSLLSFQRFSENIVTMLRSDSLRKHANNQEPVEKTEGLFIEYLPSTYTVTAFSIDREELNLPENIKTVKINHLDNTIVYLAVKDLFLSKDPDSLFEDGVLVEKHFLVTRDGVKYSLSKLGENDELVVRRF